MAEDQGGRAGMPDPFAHFQMWFNEELEKRNRQNAQLQAELDKFKQQNADLQARLDAQITTDQTSVPFATYDALRHQQEVTWKSLETSILALDKYKAKHAKARDTVKSWQAYAKRCEERARDRDAKSTTPGFLEPPTRPSSALPSSRPSVEPVPIVGVESPIHKETSPAPHASSDETEAIEDELPVLPVDRATSAPVTSYSLVRMAPPPIPDGSPYAPIQIKSEPNSSPILRAGEPSLTRMSTYDLDEAGEHIITPRKLQRMQTLMRQSSSFARSFPPPGSDRTRTTNAQAIKTSISQDEPSRALQPVSPNPQRTHPKSAARKRKHHLSEEVVSVTEDGLGVNSRARPISPTKKLKADTAIKGLLTGPGPAKRQMITPKTKTNGISTDLQAVPVHSARTNTPIAPASKAADFKKPAPFVTPARRSPRKRATPLRQRSVSDLRLEDFKLNRAAHGDMDFETMEPLRTHVDRRHMHSCADPNCATCGSALRDIAKDMHITVGSEIFANTQYDALSEDEKVLRYHLGENFSIPRLRAMGREEYEELLLTAKTAILAERYGRHKLRPNARAKSPPGYWDVEMPSTLDMEAQQAEGKRRERETVQERYREAMRKGGKWVFKDE